MLATPRHKGADDLMPAAPSAQLRAMSDPAPIPTLDALFRAHAAAVTRWAARLGGPQIEVDDVVQEVFLVVSRRLDEWRGEAQPTTWLFRITSRVVANHRRRTWLRRIWRGLTGATREEPAPPEQWPNARLAARERVAQLHAMLDALPERQRQVLILFELEEMSSAEIAHVIGVPHATVRVWLHRARSALVREADRLCARENAAHRDEAGTP
jgi:RNA polymerase sigma-70 factor (ECF subfamily)